MMYLPIIGGELIKTDRIHKVINPATGEPFTDVFLVTREDTKKAIDLADETFKKFSELPLKEKSKILIKAANIVEENKEEFAETLSLESGKPIKDSRVEVLRCINLIRIAAEEARFVLEGKVHRVDAYEYPPNNENRIVMEIREPIGVVGAILPFNFPLNSMAHKVAPVLMAGNTVVVKPSIATPISAIKLAKAFYDAGLPAGALSVLPGKSDELGEEIVSNIKIAGITFTGSTNTGTNIASKATKLGKRIMMELGGSDPIIIFEDADLSKVVPIVVRARFEYAGQNCNAGKRIFVQDKIYEPFIEIFKEHTKRMVVGNPLDEKTDMGPVISIEALRNLKEIIDDARNKGAKDFSARKEVNLKGYFLDPTILYDVPLESRALKEEVFGPVAPVVSFEKIDEAVEYANSVEYGLQAAIFTKDLKLALNLAKRIKAGGIMINDSTRLRWDALPFGGVKLSGLGGREGVRNTIYNLTEPKIISINLTA
jgi:NAD-dependent aldehyde dehydrogenases